MVCVKEVMKLRENKVVFAAFTANVYALIYYFTYSIESLHNIPWVHWHSAIGHNSSSNNNSNNINNSRTHTPTRLTYTINEWSQMSHWNSLFNFCLGWFCLLLFFCWCFFYMAYNFLVNIYDLMESSAIESVNMPNPTTKQTQQHQPQQRMMSSLISHNVFKSKSSSFRITQFA